MIKNGVTPDVITFVDATNQDINEEVLVAIQSERDISISQTSTAWCIVASQRNVMTSLP